MTAAAAAAKVGAGWHGSTGTAAALALVVGGGLVEGTAVGLAQAAGLGRLLPGLRRARWVAVTVAVAGLGWAGASAPSVLAGDEGSDAEPPLVLVLVGAAGIGLLMGAVLGGLQAVVLRGVAARPARWVAASLAGWPPAMVVLYLGATTPSAGWSLPAVVALGALTGLAAGAVLGAASYPWMVGVDQPRGTSPHRTPLPPA